MHCFISVPPLDLPFCNHYNIKVCDWQRGASANPNAGSLYLAESSLRIFAVPDAGTEADTGGRIMKSETTLRQPKRLKPRISKLTFMGF